MWSKDEAVYLNGLKDYPVQVFLGSGIKLGGKITQVNESSLILTRNTVSQLVMRHAIATVMPVTEIIDREGMYR